MAKINDNNGYLTSNLHNFTSKKVINSNHITTQGLAFPIKANNTILYPNTGDYIFNTKKVIETPMLTRNYRPTFQMGGPQMEQPQEGQEQIMQMVMQALQQGTPPEQIMQMLVQQGIPQEQAQMIIQQVMSQVKGQMSQQQPTNEIPQEQPMMKHGGMLQFLQKGGLSQFKQYQGEMPMEVVANMVNGDETLDYSKLPGIENMKGPNSPEVIAFNKQMSKVKMSPEELQIEGRRMEAQQRAKMEAMMRDPKNLYSFNPYYNELAAARDRITEPKLGMIGPPAYQEALSQLNYNKKPEFTKEQIFGNLNFGPQPKPLKSIQRVKVPSFSNSTSFGDAFSKARKSGAQTFTYNGKLYTTEQKNDLPVNSTTYKGTDLKPVIIKAKRLKQTVEPLAKSPFAFTTNTIPKDKITKSNPQGMISKGWEILNNPVEAFGYGARNQRIPDHFSKGPNGRNAYDMALEIPKFGIPLGKAFEYGKGLINNNVANLTKTLTQQIATQLPKLIKNPGATHAAITGYLNTLRKVGTIESNQIANTIENAAKNPTQLRKLYKMLKQTHLMDLQ